MHWSALQLVYLFHLVLGYRFAGRGTRMQRIRAPGHRHNGVAQGHAPRIGRNVQKVAVLGAGVVGYGHDSG